MIFAIVSHGNNLGSGFQFVGQRSEFVYRHCGHIHAAPLPRSNFEITASRRCGYACWARRYAWRALTLLPLRPLSRAVCRLFAVSKTPRCKRVGSLLTRPQPIGSARDRRTIIVNPVGK